MKSFLKNWKTSLCAVAQLVVTFLLGHHNIDVTTATLATGIIGTIAHSAAADGSNLPQN